ncbi:NXPE family member 3-like [Anguilla anguilla]|uniref:NXPE family member 3-like n=1 Tax=Anguilla anguilla TaxID=7936 RepID=UPI0015B293E7|nr:NXPE family member 3-like [Anguilla anguilla]
MKNDRQSNILVQAPASHQNHVNSDDLLTTLLTPLTTKPMADIGIAPQEWHKILDMLHWPGPDKQIEDLSASTDPSSSYFYIPGLQKSYQVGEELCVTVVARDFHQNPKPYGGDFFQAKLYSPNLKAGPLLAVDVENNILLHWRAHGIPLRSRTSPIADLHYISNEIDGIAGGPHKVIGFTIWAHFTSFPLKYYIRRVARIRQAVIALLKRAPDTIVAIKSANTSYKTVYGSDWFSIQLDTILRATFQGINVAFIDVWQMTSCHYSPENIHPNAIINQNEINLLMSFICPV